MHQAGRGPSEESKIEQKTVEKEKKIVLVRESLQGALGSTSKNLSFIEPRVPKIQFFKESNDKLFTNTYVNTCIGGN